MIRALQFTASAFLVLCTVSLAKAVVVAEWNLTGNTGTEATEAASLLAPNITSAVITRGPSLTGSGAANSMSASGWDGSDAGDYFAFSFTVASGFTVDLGALSVGTRSSSTGPGTIGVYTQLDGFAAPLTTISQGPGGNFVNTVVDLSSLPNVTGTFELRLYEVLNVAANGAGATASTGTFRVADYFSGGDLNLPLTGTISAVPEASSFLFGSLIAGVVGAGYVGRRVLRKPA